MRKEDILSHFANAIIMGKEIFKNYEERAQDKDLKKNLKDFISSFDTQYHNLKKTMKRLNLEIEEDQTLLQKNAILMEKIKTKTINNDFDLCITIIKAMNGALVGALKYFRKCDCEMRSKLLEIVQAIISNYENIMGKIKNYTLKSMC